MHSFLRVGFVLFLAFSSSALAAECPSPQKERLLILPFEGPNKPLGVLLAVLLKEYLAPMKMKGTDAETRLSGTLKSEKEGYRLSASLTRSNEPLLKFEGDFQFPSTLNDLLVSLAGEVSNALKAKIAEKKLLPYLNVTTSPQAYLSYGEGSLYLERAGPEAFRQAVASFEKAIREDYNYVPAYLGLAEALAGLSALEPQSAGLAVRARIELEKAKLLNPVLAKARKDRIERYLKGERPTSCGS